MENSKPEREYVDRLPKSASFVENSNEYANNFVNFPYPETIEWYTVTGDNANKPNCIIKETFYQ